MGMKSLSYLKIGYKMNKEQIEIFNSLMKPECYRCYHLFRSISDPYMGFRCHTTPSYCPSKFIKSIQKEPDFTQVEREIEIMKQMLVHYESLRNPTARMI